MVQPRIIFVSLLVLSAVSLGGCAKPTNYATLLPRATESEDAQRATAGVARPVGPTAPTPEIAAQLTAIAERSARGASEFNATLAMQRQAVELAHGAAPKSEAWVAGQQALSVIEAARAPCVAARSDADALYAQAKIDGVGLTEIAEVQRTLVARVENQDGILASLAADLSQLGTASR